VKGPLVAEQVMVRFAGDGHGTGELTWGQRYIWHPMRMRGSSLGISAVRRLPAGTTLQDIVAELRYSFGTFQTMRTRLRFTAGDPPRQLVEPAGEFALEVVEAGGEDPTELAKSLVRRFEATPFDYPAEWPVRAAAVLRRGRPVRLAKTISHLAVDGAAVGLMLAGRAPVPGPQPLELARIEAGPAAQRCHDAAMRYWRRVLRTIPPERFAGERPRPGPRYRQASYESPGLRLAQRVVAARTGTGASAVLLAAFAVGLARVTGAGPVVAQIIVSNRFRPGLATVVAPVSQSGLCTLDLHGMVFDDAVRRAANRTMSAYKYAYYDRPRLHELIAEVDRERGRRVDLGCFYNDRRPVGSAAATGPAPTRAELRAAAARGRLRWDPPLDSFNEKLMVHVAETEQSVNLLIQADCHYLSPDDVEALLREIESVVVGSAATAG
jgi:hypothetical protein